MLLRVFHKARYWVLYYFLLYINDIYIFFFIMWMATRKGTIITSLAILLDTAYAFCMFYYYI